MCVFVCMYMWCVCVWCDLYECVVFAVWLYGMWCVCVWCVYVCGVICMCNYMGYVCVVCVVRAHIYWQGEAKWVGVQNPPRPAPTCQLWLRQRKKLCLCVCHVLEISGNDFACFLWNKLVCHWLLWDASCIGTILNYWGNSVLCPPSERGSWFYSRWQCAQTQELCLQRLGKTSQERWYLNWIKRLCVHPCLHVHIRQCRITKHFQVYYLVKLLQQFCK